jgi:peptidoglycan/xylan/chitin deacetylase (PgdA/CDA1 family)
MRRRSVLAGAGAATLVRAARAAQGISVLAYHRFDPAVARAATVVTEATLDAQMAWLAVRHIRVLPLAEAVAALGLGGPAVCITADDGFRSVYTGLFPVLRRHGFPATLFLNPPMIGHGGAFLTWAQIEEMRASGLVDVQAHTMTHPNFREQKVRRSPADYASFVTHELAGSARAIETRLGGKVRFLAWPYGIHDAQLEAAAKDAGFEAAFALGSRAALPGGDMFALPRYQVYETDNESRFAAIARGLPRG